MRQVICWWNSSIMMRKYSCCSSVVCLSFTILNIFDNTKGIIGLFQKKPTPSQRKANWKISRVQLCKSRWEGSSEPTNTSSGVNYLLSILSMFQSLQSISFQKITEINYQEINLIFKFYSSFKLYKKGSSLLLL